MPNLNRVTIMGNLTRDPEIRYTQKGTAVCEIGLAINETWKGDDGQKNESTLFVDVTFWGKTAEVVGEHCKKGRPLYVEGRLQLDTWDDKQTGQKRSRLKVVGDNFQFLGGRDDGERSSGQKQERRSEPTRTGPPRSQQGAPPSGPADDDDIPFLPYQKHHNIPL